jgi:hypothetical protein
MTDMEKVNLAFDILEDADIVEEFEDSLFIRVDKAMWNQLWGNDNEQDTNQAD